MVQGVLAGLLVSILLIFSMVRYGSKAVYPILLVVLWLALANWFLVYEGDREKNTRQKISLSEITLMNVALNASHGNFYVLSAVVNNHSRQFKLRTLTFEVRISTCAAACSLQEVIIQKARVWLEPGAMKPFRVQIPSEFQARTLADKEWQYRLVSNTAS